MSSGHVVSVLAADSSLGPFVFAAGSPEPEIVGKQYPADDETGTWYALNAGLLNQPYGIATLDVDTRLVQPAKNTLVAHAYSAFNGPLIQTTSTTFAALSGSTHSLSLQAGDIVFARASIRHRVATASAHESTARIAVLDTGSVGSGVESVVVGNTYVNDHIEWRYTIVNTGTREFRIERKTSDAGYASQVEKYSFTIQVFRP